MLKLKHSSQKQESLVYLVLWAALFMAPVISMQFRHAESDVFPWAELLDVWFQTGILLAVFLIHNCLLAPILVYSQRRMLYFSSILVLTGCFVLLQCVQRPEQRNRRPPMEQIDHRPPMPDEQLAPNDRPPFHGKPVNHPPLIFGQHDFIATVMLILMLGMNIGVKLYFKERLNQDRLAKLERENLQQQLEYLRYQVNPHFLMNTLNNIHALVDIDGERAKETIVELSRILRYALYEGSRQRVPLRRDVEFMQGYISLMRLRYTDKVSIEVNVSDSLPDCEVPPMLFITFIENAFKHGVSYQQDSFISISLQAIGNRLLFTCSNSKPQHPNKHEGQEGGVGLQNIKRRLQLIYAGRYRLDISDQGKVYSVEMEIPTVL